MRKFQWFKSSASGNDSNCLEVFVTDTEVRVRNSNIPQSPEVPYTFAEWEAFVKGVKNGEFDLP